MKLYKKILFILPVLFLVGAGRWEVSRTPLELFLLRGSDNLVEAYRLKVYLNRREPVVEPLHLTGEQSRLGMEILRLRDKAQLSVFARSFGPSEIWIGFPTADEAWPGYLGGGWDGFRQNGSGEVFDNLQWMDRLYLSLRSTPPPPSAPSQAALPPAGETATPVPGEVKENPGPSRTPVPAGSPGVLRVEILNGCGIKGAADWAARRFKGAGVTIVGTGNAENFRFNKTIIKTSAGIPIALEEALERLGLAKDSVEDSTDPAMDVVVIIGRDFRKLKERVRERNQH